jgi:hypothetical protein
MASIVQTVPIGTNIALVHLLWVMVNGSFLSGRGAVFAALSLGHFRFAEMRRSWRALRSGVWEINELLDHWQLFVASENQWRARRSAGYQVLSVDITAFWRPRLQGWLGKHYHALAQKALPAVVVGVMVTSGQVGVRRIPLLRRIVRCQPQTSEREFRPHLLQAAVTQLAPDQVMVVDAGFELAEVQAAAVPRYVVRLATNCTARRNVLPAYRGKGRRPTRGELVRPLPRRWQARPIAATPPDHESQFAQEGRSIHVACWYDLVLPQTPVAVDAATFAIYVFHDPLYKQPLVLASNLALTPQTVFLLYRDRWPVEHPPLAAKQMIGLHRQFVFAPESCFRLPELSLLAGSVLTYLAAVLPPVPSGFWDRTPTATPGRLRRLLAQADFPNLAAFDPELRKKNSLTAHLPKGIDAHRRTKLAA